MARNNRNTVRSNRRRQQPKAAVHTPLDGIERRHLRALYLATIQGN